ncbi:tRNA (adenosine(37)-N6)-threonylcarbamoyltransferase complex ATPase subunit type 1 TsaE [Zunongwangia sp. F363]|uniref:tRNA threonylcarbamoyladenosine biosynthesis protein TsaE n=1 Tax=Autumnicola tepida TaxID=3075595 RepID=A0ABU3CCR0_9FLAO|nr:tRNA (adenosine(37)-N6)-threonylcarbamoyltransferase complex ATPase subunit type 1 TsaE [Zunongwangia sp. F363]MDT0644007.1 tRNA (adenosine(37)-N6)-threonylcarbamoyltransferase complex ATPase subunit type 1 TsaE [Zunongwangia sp. F363]
MSLTYDLDQMDMAVHYILSHTKSRTLLFYGEMGAGKTTLINALARELGVEEPASSPTFSLVNEYHSQEGTIFHFDFYRIESEAEALDMGIEDYFNTEAWKFVEWPQKIQNLLPQDVQKVEITVKNEYKRLLKLC